MFSLYNLIASVSFVFLLMECYCDITNKMCLVFKQLIITGAVSQLKRLREIQGNSPGIDANWL